MTVNMYDLLAQQEDEKLVKFVDKQEQEWIRKGFPALGNAQVEQEFTEVVTKKTNKFAHKPVPIRKPKPQNEEMIAKFKCTKPCDRVVRILKNPEGHPIGPHGVCTREQCTFAHSMQEFRLVPCRFGDRCYKDDCYFFHPEETVATYHKRMGKEMPDLPQTGEGVRKPKVVPEPKAVAEPKVVPEPKAVVVPVAKDAKVPAVEPAPAGVVRIRVPAFMFEMAMEQAIAKGLQNFEILLTDS